MTDDRQGTSVGEDFPVQQARVRKIQKAAREIGPGEAFLVALTEGALRRAEKAAMSGDLVEILKSYQELREFKE